MSAVLAAPPPVRLLTAAEFLADHGTERGVELVRGRLTVPTTTRPEDGTMPRFRHGVVSYRATRALSDFVEANRLGWIAINDTFVQTETDPDTVRGADVLFVSFARLPDGPIPDDLPTTPDLVLEVRSPTDRWNAVFTKVGEYLAAGVTVVIVVDPGSRSVLSFRDGSPQQTFAEADTLTVPDVLPGFALPVAHLFA